jgi:hypothetical protein
MRIASLAMVVVFVTASALPAVAKRVVSQSACRPRVAVSVPRELRPFVKNPRALAHVAGQCQSAAPRPGFLTTAARRPGFLPTCTSNSHITCRGSCSGGGPLTITWTCCFDPGGFAPACSLDCDREIAACLDQ